MNFILTSDLHLRANRPKCRTDKDWIETQRKCLEFIKDMALTEDCNIVITGDIFHAPQAGARIEAMFLDVFSEFSHSIFILAGQHDLPNHNWENVMSSSFGVLYSTIGNTNIYPAHILGKAQNWGCEFIGVNDEFLFMHTLVFETKNDIPPNVDAMTAEEVLKKYPKAKWIFAGDQHHGFHYEKDGQHVIVPGCINIQAADMIEYDPVIWHVDAEKNVVKPILVPTDKSLINIEYLEMKKERGIRLTGLSGMIEKGKLLGLDYEKNVLDEMPEQKFSKGVEKIILNSLGR